MPSFVVTFRGAHFPLKYVRREIRQLTDSDREAFFDAMETLYRLPTAEGHAMYGDDYKVGSCET